MKTGTLVAPANVYWARYAFAAQVKEGQFEVLNLPVSCTDHMTDMFARGVDMFDFKRAKLDKNNTCFIFGVNNGQQREALEHNLKYIHAIEKANHFKRTELYWVTPTQVVVVGSLLWSKCTARLSLYMKFFRNLYNGELTANKIPYENFGPRENISEEGFKFLSWLMYEGHLRKMNHGCKHLHGYSEMGYADHSNNGIQWTVMSTVTNIHRAGSERKANMEKLYAQFNKETV